MKGTPFKTRRLTSPFMLAEAGLGGSEGVDPVVEEENTGKKIAGFFTPESVGEAMLGVLPVGGKGISKWLTKSKMGKKVLNKIPGLSKLFTKSKVVKNKPIDFSKSRDFSGKAKQMQTTGGVSGKGIKVDKNYKYETFDAKTTPRSVTNATNVKGTDLDNFVKGKPTVYTKEHITKLPSKGGRPFVKVDLPNGGEQIFYKSSGTGGKAGSKGEWIPFEGFRPGGWFVKTGSKGKFAGKNMETIFTHHNAAGDVISKADWIKQGSQQKLKNSHGVYEQIQKLGLDPWEEISKGTLKIDKWGQGFKYGSKEYTKIAEQLKNMDL